MQLSDIFDPQDRHHILRSHLVISVSSQLQHADRKLAKFTESIQLETLRVFENHPEWLRLTPQPTLELLDHLCQKSLNAHETALMALFLRLEHPAVTWATPEAFHEAAKLTLSGASQLPLAQISQVYQQVVQVQDEVGREWSPNLLNLARNLTHRNKTVAEAAPRPAEPLESEQLWGPLGLQTLAGHCGTWLFWEVTSIYPPSNRYHQPSLQGMQIQVLENELQKWLTVLRFHQLHLQNPDFAQVKHAFDLHIERLKSQTTHKNHAEKVRALEKALQLGGVK